MNTNNIYIEINVQKKKNPMIEREQEPMKPLQHVLLICKVCYNFLTVTYLLCTTVESFAFTIYASGKVKNHSLVHVIVGLK